MINSTYIFPQFKILVIRAQHRRGSNSARKNSHKPCTSSSLYERKHGLDMPQLQLVLLASCISRTFDDTTSSSLGRSPRKNIP